MSDANFNARVTRSAARYTRLQAQNGRDGERIFLLRRTQQSGDFTQLVELTEGARIIYGELREEIFLFYATTANFSDTWAQATHIGFGVPVSNKVFVYEIQPEQKERTLPDVNSSKWKAFAVRKSEERHTIAETYYLTVGGNHLTVGGNRLILQ